MAQNSSGINTLYVCPVYWGCSVHWGDTMSTLGGYHEYIRGLPLVHWGGDINCMYSNVFECEIRLCK